MMESADQALLRWQSILDKEPNNDNAAAGLMRALGELDRPDEIIRHAQAYEAAGKTQLADRVLRAAAKGMPQHFAVAEAYCNLAEARGDRPEATKRWILIRTFLRKHDPKRVDGHLGYINFMIRQRRFDDAERGAMAALMALGNQPDLNTAYARLAEMQGHWKEAAERWSTLTRYPADHPDAAENQRFAEQRALEVTDAPDAADGPGALIPRVKSWDKDEAAAIKAMLTGFESLGYNCEFGLLQRKFKAEPLGLLRYSQTFVSTLKAMLNERFAGMGDPNCMNVIAYQNEYRLAHNTYNWQMHTRIPDDGKMDAATVLKEGAKRIGYLRRKLIEDLEDQNKIFVLQKSDLTDREIDEVYAAMQEYGPCMLLCVRLYDDHHPRGSVEWRAERLLVGALDRIGNSFPGAGWDISVDYWIYFCRLAQARWDELRAVPRVAAVA